MDLGISGKVAMVAAASKGIGFAVAKSLVEEGCRVSVCSRSLASAQEAAIKLGPNAKGFACDVSQAEQIARWYSDSTDARGPAQILVTNTGGPPAGTWTGMTDEQWLEGFQSTLMNVVRMVRLAEGHMRAGRWGRIVHITSLVAKEPATLLPISSTLRSGIGALTRLHSTELAPFGITANAVLPGHTLTDRQRHLAEVIAARDGISQQEALDRQGKSVPAGRLAEPSEIAAAVAFLCSEQAAYINGVNLLVDGGLTRATA